MTLYNAKTEGDSLRVTKFDDDLNVESSYLTSPNECTCPAGSRSTCRHRQMYPNLRMIADTGNFWDYEAGVQVDLDDGDHRFNKEDYA